MKTGSPRKLNQLFRPSVGLHGPPPSNISYECFLLEDDARNNGEIWFYEKIKPFINSMYDVGADATFYTNFSGEVHYFEPVTSGYPPDDDIFKKTNEDLGNLKSYFNKFGLSSVSIDRLKITWEAGDVLPNPNGDDLFLGDNIYMKVKRGDDYIKENGFSSPDFISLDVEGHELEVLRGFGECLCDIKIVQFEWGGTSYSANVKLGDIIGHLKNSGFCDFFYLAMANHRLVPMNWSVDSENHYAYCNIVGINENYLDEVLSWVS